MSTQTPMKSILKQRSPETKPNEENAQAEKDNRNLSIALNHANRIDLQKKIQMLILQNIETLMDLPSTPSSQLLSAKDAQTFTTLIHPFQPSDFAALVEERRINGSCGYALCPNPPRSETLGASAAWKLKGKGAGDFCSTDCVRKALYVKAQLSGVPAWERVAGQQGVVVLPEGDRVGDTGGGSVGSDHVKGVANGRDLAAERGEEATSFKPQQVMMDSVIEQPRSKSATAPSFPQRPTDESSYGAIEGYESRFSGRRDGEYDSDEDEDASSRSQGVDFTSEVRAEDDDFDEEEEAAWRELQAGLRQLNTGHDR